MTEQTRALLVELEREVENYRGTCSALDAEVARLKALLDASEKRAEERATALRRAEVLIDSARVLAVATQMRSSEEAFERGLKDIAAALSASPSTDREGATPTHGDER